MPRNRRSEVCATDQILVRSLGLSLPHDYRIESHSHDWHQLVYATRGVMSVVASDGTWVVPSHRAVWIPARCTHEVRMTGNVRMRTLYLRHDLRDDLPGSCCAIDVSPLLRELILETIRVGMLTATVPEFARLTEVLLDQITHIREAPLVIKLPTDPRARRLAQNVRDDLSAKRTIADWARGSGASVRTIERLFLKETGLSFGRWLRRVKVLYALERLAAGDSVTAAGHAVGYENTSAFIAMFKTVLGTTPSRYFPRADPHSDWTAEQVRIDP